MPSKQTANYKLSQWSKDDRVLMDDFNADNAKINAAIKAVDSRVDGLASSKANQSSLYTISQTLSKKAEIVVGSYKGDGAETRTISMGFTPKAVFLFTTDGYTNYSSTYYGGLAITGSPVTRGNTPFIEIVSGGFRLTNKTISGVDVRTNYHNTTYNYVAIV